MDPSAVAVVVGGHDLTRFARVGRVRIDDILNDAPNTAALTIVLAPRIGAYETAPFAPHAFDGAGFATADNPSPVLVPPPVLTGAPIAIFSNNGADQIFGGEILTVAQYAEFDQPQHVRLDLTCTDYTRRLNRRKVEKDYKTASATAIVLDLIATFAPGIGTDAVQADLDHIDGGITFTFEDVGRALSRIAEKIGAYWYVDYVATLHFFVGTEDVPDPDPITLGARFADLKITTDLSQVRTRVLVEGDGATAALTLPAGDSILPVTLTSPFNPAGGLAVVGPARVSYTGIIAGGAKANTTGPTTGGSAAGPPPAPPAAPTATLAAAGTAGALAGGPYYYATTVELADGSRSSLGTGVGPVTITAASAPPPTTAALATAPAKGPIPVGVTSSYATTFVDANGRETAATLGGTLLTGRPVGDPASLFVGAGGGSGTIASGYYDYAMTFLTPAGETLPTFFRGVFITGPTGGATLTLPTTGITVPGQVDGRIIGRRIYRSTGNPTTTATVLPWRQVVDIPNNTATSYLDLTADANLSTKNFPQFSTATDVGEAATVTVPVSADARVAKRRIYRKDGPGTYRLIAELPDNTTTSFVDVTIGAGGDLAPTVNAITTGAVNLSNLAIGPAGTARRRIFRTAAGGSQFRELVEIDDNTTTTYADTTADSNLGGAPQPPIGSPAVAGTIPPTPAGREYLQVDDATGFPSAGWLLLESGMMIRYAAIDTVGGYCGGIPASGPGAITADIPAGSIVSVAPALVGVAPVLGVSLGDAVQLIAQVDDVAAQTALAAIEGGDGVIENYIQDRRLSEAGARARGLADLELFKTAETQVTYTTWDPKTRSGRTVSVDLPDPTNLTGDFLIQRVTIDDVATWAHQLPRRKVQASTTRFSFDDVLNRILLESH